MIIIKTAISLCINVNIKPQCLSKGLCKNASRSVTCNRKLEVTEFE